MQLGPTALFRWSWFIHPTPQAKICLSLCFFFSEKCCFLSDIFLMHRTMKYSSQMLHRAAVSSTEVLQKTSKSNKQIDLWVMRLRLLRHKNQLKQNGCVRLHVCSLWTSGSLLPAPTQSSCAALEGFEQSVNLVGDEQPPELKGQLLWTIRVRDDRITFTDI